MLVFIPAAVATMSDQSNIVKNQPKRSNTSHAFIDASNLFYGGKKSLGWSIDYKKLHSYLKTRYNCRRIYYFGGIEIHDFNHQYQRQESVALQELIKHLRKVAKTQVAGSKRHQQTLKHIQRVKFYKKLQDFGYLLILKPVKEYRNPDGTKRRKANSDLDMTLFMIKEMNKYNEALVLTGDGDFLPVLKYLKHNKKKITILARGPRTAREVKQFAGANFRDFGTLRTLLEQRFKTSKKKK